MVCLFACLCVWLGGLFVLVVLLLSSDWDVLCACWLFVCLLGWLFVCLFVCLLFVCLPFACLFVCLFVSLYPLLVCVFLSFLACLVICLSAQSFRS